LDLTNPDKDGLFPVTRHIVQQGWSDVPYEYWSGQPIHQVMAEAAQQVDPNFQWSPFTDFVYTTYADLLTQVKAGTITLQDAMQQLQDKSVTYAKDQGFTVQ
jgi:multiple sugar transport system substrate-binding protein